MPEATFWNLQFKEWIRLEWRFSRSLSWAQGISIVLNRYSLYSRFKGLISMEIISKATLITVLYRNERKVNRPSKLLDPEVAMTEGLLGDYNWVPNIYIFSLSFLPAPGGSSDSLLCIPDIYSPVFCWDSRHSYLVERGLSPTFLMPSPAQVPYLRTLKVCIVLWGNTCGSDAIALTFMLETHTESGRRTVLQCYLPCYPPAHTSDAWHCQGACLSLTLSQLLILILFYLLA